MLIKSQNYDTIFANPAHYAETMLIIGEPGDTRVTVVSADIMSLSTHCSLYGDYIDIGKCIINSFEAVLTGYNATQIPKMSRVEIWTRIKDSNGTSNWLPKGIYYTRKPKYDTESGFLSISGLDLMYRGESLPYPLGSTVSGWNLETTRTVANRMATFMGIDLEQIFPVPEYDFALPPLGFTAREILHDIATACCGNFTLTYTNIGTQSAPIMKPWLRFLPIDTISLPVQLGRNVQHFERGDVIPQVSYVDVNYGYDQNGATLSKGCGTPNGVRDVEFTISTITDGLVIQDIANDLYATLATLTFIPFTAEGLPLDPACECGDIVTCNGLTAPLGSIDTFFSKAMYANIVSPGIPEEEDFPMYSQDRDIQKNYDTEASKIAGAVKFVNLSTAGETEINGSNIKSGTITLGGANNGNGQLSIVDANDNEIGKWNNERLLIKDDTADVDYSTSAKLAIINKSEQENTQYGAFIGATVHTQTQETSPFMYLNGSTGNSILLDSSTIKLSDSNSNEATIAPTPIAHQYGTVTRASGLTIASQTLRVWGRVIQLTLKLNASSGSYSAGSNIFTGAISSVLKPIADAMGCGYYSSGSYAGRIDESGNITIRATSNLDFSGGEATISFTYLF